MDNRTLGSWINMEHYRLHCVEEWSDGPRKEAALAAIHSSLERLAAVASSEPTCMVCAARRNAMVLKFPSRPQSSPANTPMAA